MLQRNLSSEFGQSLTHNLPQTDSDSECPKSDNSGDDFKSRPVSSGEQILEHCFITDRQTADISSAVS